MTTYAVLCFLLREGRVLLIRKKKGFGAGKITGAGGRIEPGESPEEAAVREVREELGVVIRSLKEVGLLEFYSASPEPDWVVHVFLSLDFDGEPRASEEADPIWVSVDELPLSQMWQDDSVWLRHALSGRFVKGRFWFDKDYTRMLRWEVTVSV